jgi:SAM-dependent methyltransferase
VEPTACPLCGGELRPSGIAAIDRLVTGDGPFRVLECRSCNYGVTELRGLDVADYYGGDYFEAFYEHDRAAPFSPLERARERYRHGAARRRFSRAPFAVAGLSPGRVLDVGCGGGELLEHYSRLGWATFGIDPSPAAVAAARRRAGASVHQGTLADQPWAPGSFDLVVFSHSLEHIPEPLDALRSARALLAPGGALAIHAPSWRCWQLGIFAGFWFHLDLPRHLQHFSTRALVVAADALDLDIDELGTDATLISVAYSIHYVLAGRWTPGWRLWLSYALGVAVYPLVGAVNRLRGADCCYAVMRLPRD